MGAPAGAATGRPSRLGEQVLDWYGVWARDLPWRGPQVSAWAVLVSEVMLQQTPVARVVPVFLDWLERWPTPGALAADAPGDAVRYWGRLGYPRRALRLHAAATACVAEHGGCVPERLPELLALPGVGEYTARAVLAFAYGQRQPVIDVNVARVLARAVRGVAQPGASVTRGERDLVAGLLPADGAQAASTSAALMELGATVCVARTPRCQACPLAATCAWRQAGQPAGQGPNRRSQPWHGSDRQVRGRVLAELRSHPGPVLLSALTSTSNDAKQRERAVAGLLADGLVERDGPDRLVLPGPAPRTAMSL